MKSKITKLATAAVIIIAVVFLITFFDKAATPAYALEQTIEANHTIKTVHLRMFEGGRSIENNEFTEYWIKYDNAGKLSNLRCNGHDKDSDTFSVWNDGVLKTWLPENNVVFIIRLNNTDKKWEDFAKEFEPKFRLQWLYDQSEDEEAIEIKIDEPAEDSNSIYVKATSSVHKVRAELVVDRKTKLIKKFSIYRLGDQGYELDMRFEFLAYNQPIDPSMFELRGIPDNAKVYDQVNRLVGLEKGDLTNKEIAAKVVREGLEATIAKDYDEASRLMEGDPGDTIEEFIEKEFEAGLVRVVSIGQPETHEKNEFFVYVPCEIEVENEERRRWLVNIIATAKAIEYQDDRWIMHTDLRVSEPYILSTSALNEQDRIEGNIIVPGLRVGDYNLGISKDQVLRKLGEPEKIFGGGERYTLDNLPKWYYMSFGEDISFMIEDDTVTEIGVHSPLYRFTNGLGVGDSEQKIKQAFGDDFHLREGQTKDFLTYEDKGLQFEIYKMNRMVIEIGIYQPTGDHEEGENDTSDINQKIAQICTGPSDFNDVITIFGQPSDYKWSGQSFKLEDLPVERYWIWYPDSIHVFMKWDKVDMLEIVDSAYVFNGKIPMGSSLERVLSIVGQPKETVIGQRGWEDGVLYKDINGRIGWCQYRREDLNADFRFLNNALKCVHILEIKGSSTTAGRTFKRGSFQTVKTIKSVNEFEDVRSKDLSKADFSSSKGLIATLSFNQQTVWPEQNKMPTGSGPQKILTNAMNPGLGVRKLHQQGITGKGVNVAIIDQPLFLDHPEFAGKIVAYYDTGCDTDECSMHGPAVASLLVGINCGTAPSAQIYYAAAPSWKADAAYYAKGLDWIIAQNEKLPNGEKIRVVSVSAAPSGPGSPFKKNREMWDQACGRAEADGIMVLDCTNSHRGFINRGWYNPGDPESVIEFNLGPPPKREFRVNSTEMSLYVPSSVRTTAEESDEGECSYIYWGRGGLSWSIPYCAGVLAMGWQICPDLIPAQMKEMLFASAHEHKSGAKIINPTAFIELIRNQSGNQHIRTRPQTNSETQTIVPGLRVGDYTLGMSKDEILRKLGEPETIQLGLLEEGEDEVVRRGEEKYNLNNLPRGLIIMAFGNISFWIEDDSVGGISVRSPLYKLSSGLKVGDSEQKIKQAFGEDFQIGEGKDLRLREDKEKGLLFYDAKGLGFEIHKKNQTIAEIIVYEPEGVPRVPRVLRTLPKYDPDSGNPFQVDLRCRDLTKLDLRNSIEDLMFADFDERTVWPAPNRMPSEFDWQKIMELGKNPGLGVRSLHEKGITGRGVRVAILDQPLLVDHQEYAERLRFYEEIDLQGRTEPSMHGAGVASIALGKTVGVAPEAELYYIAQWNVDWDKGTDSLRTLARGIHRMLEINEQLPKDNKIRVISISRGWMPSHKDYKEITEAVQKAQAAGMLVVCSGIESVHEGFDFSVLGRSPLADPEVFESYEPGLFLAKHFRARRSSPSEDCFWVPMDSRTTASETGSNEYVFYRIGGVSWAIPYIAGVYALAVQVDPAITPERFWALAVQTGRTIELKDNGETMPLGPIIAPARLIRSIKAGELSNLNRKQSDNQQIRKRPRTYSETKTIVPGQRVGDYTLGMSKDEVLRKLGEPDSIQLEEDEVIHRGDPKYSLNNLPSDCILAFGDVSFLIKDDSVKAIFVRSPLYKFNNGLKVGDSEQKMKQAFGEDFHLEESLGKDYLCYDAKWLAFEINEKNQTIAEIVTFQPKVDRPESAQVALVRKAASDGRILYKVTTPEEFREIAGQPTKEWMEDDDECIYMEYPGIEVKFVGKPESNIPHTIIYVLCERMGIDIGQDRPIDEGDLDQQPDRSDRDAPDSDKIVMLSEQPPGPITFPKIDRKPKPAGWRRGEMKSLPKYDPDLRNPGQVDLRCYDLSKLDLRNSIENLMYANFDDRTVWPAPNQMPSNFNRQTIMELGKNPGLGVRTLHKRGITGKGVGVAIIDQPLLTEHQEYADCLRLYEENNVRDGTHSAMHGPAVASIAVGKTVGVAPDADLYYIASWGLTRDDDPRDNFVFRAQAIQRLLEINRQLPANRKIRVISNSIGWSPSQDGYDEITAACEEAKAAGIFVVTCGIIEPYGFDFGGLGRHPLANPDSFKSYGPCLDWAKIFYRSIPGRDSDALWIPEDSRTTASPTGSDEYVFYRQGGASWCAPYIAGVYALTVQVEPEITPERFWALAMKTGRNIELEHEGHKRSFGPIIDPVALISTLQKK